MSGPYTRAICDGCDQYIKPSQWCDECDHCLHCCDKKEGYEMNLTKKVLAKLDELKKMACLDLYQPQGCDKCVTCIAFVALRRQVEKHTPSDIKYARGFIGCKACSGFGFQQYPCAFIKEVATDLGISE